MAKKPETKFKEKVQARLDEIPNLYHRKIQQVTIRGMPDILACYKGKFIALELKVGKNDIDPLQEYEINKIHIAGGLARVVRPDNLEDIIEEILCL